MLARSSECYIHGKKAVYVPGYHIPFPSQGDWHSAGVNLWESQNGEDIAAVNVKTGETMWDWRRCADVAYITVS